MEKKKVGGSWEGEIRPKHKQSLLEIGFSVYIPVSTLKLYFIWNYVAKIKGADNTKEGKIRSMKMFIKFIAFTVLKCETQIPAKKGNL